MTPNAFLRLASRKMFQLPGADHRHHFELLSAGEWHLSSSGADDAIFIK